VVLAGNSLAGAVAAIELGRATKRNIRQNLFWALCYNSVCIPVAAGVLYPVCSLLLTPMIASAAMSLSSVFVVCNALRLWRFTPVALARRSGEPNRTENKEKEKETMLFRKKEVEEYVIAVQGMACGHCAARVESALLAIKGVKSAKVDLTTASVAVRVVGVAESALKDAITAAGYTVGE
jgi:Cu+-exporting ATPase